MNAGGATDGRTPRWTPIDGEHLRFEQSNRPPEPSPEIEKATAEAWSALHHANQRLFNGPILAVLEADPARTLIRVRRDEFRRLAVQPEVPTGVIQLGVTAVLTARSRAGRPLALLGRRHASTRVFGGMWELGPGGGVEPPIDNRPLDTDHLRQTLLEEIRQELGPDEAQAARHTAAPVGLLRDPIGHSLDIVFRVSLSAPPPTETPAPASWEYDELRWIPTDDPDAPARLGPVAPPTQTLWRTLFRP